MAGRHRKWSGGSRPLTVWVRSWCVAGRLAAMPKRWRPAGGSAHATSADREREVRWRAQKEQDERERQDSLQWRLAIADIFERPDFLVALLAATAAGGLAPIMRLQQVSRACLVAVNANDGAWQV